MKYSPAIQKLIDAIGKLPGMGPKTSARLAFFLLKDTTNVAENLKSALETIKTNIVVCQTCLNFAENSPCHLCSDKTRDRSVICIVATPQELQSIERTGDFHGLYHVLGGVLAPTEGVTPEHLNITQLVTRIQNDGIKEVIIALNPDLEGETTTLYLKKVLEPFKLRLTRLARGLPMGSDIEYADEITLRSALEGRKEL